MNTICLVACTSKKSSYPSSAQDLYRSPLFEGSKWYAENRSDQWFILSAKHGLLAPSQTVEPYDESLHGMSDSQRQVWARKVYQQLEKIIDPSTRVVFLAGDKYRKYLEPLLENDGHLTAAPLAELGIGRQVAWLQRLAAENARLADIDRFYGLLERISLASKAGWQKLGKCEGGAIPKRGIYFFREDNEIRMTSPFEQRAVRIGTHAVSTGSKATLWNRLRTHRGGADGKGNHRGSIFRLHVGQSLIKSTGRDSNFPTWGIGQNAAAEIKNGELSLELEVSKVICEMHMLYLEINDDSSPDSDRAYIERNSIALLAGPTGPIDLPSKSWLGLHSNREAVAFSGLWNVNHVFDEYDPHFLDVLERYVERVENRSPPLTSSLAPKGWRLKTVKLRTIKQQIELM